MREQWENVKKNCDAPLARSSQIFTPKKWSKSQRLGLMSKSHRILKCLVLGLKSSDLPRTTTDLPCKQPATLEIETEATEP